MWCFSWSYTLEDKMKLTWAIHDKLTNDMIWYDSAIFNCYDIDTANDSDWLIFNLHLKDSRAMRGSWFNDDFGHATPPSALPRVAIFYGYPSQPFSDWCRCCAQHVGSQTCGPETWFGMVSDQNDDDDNDDDDDDDWWSMIMMIMMMMTMMMMIDDQW